MEYQFDLKFYLVLKLPIRLPFSANKAKYKKTHSLNHHMDHCLRTKELKRSNCDSKLQLIAPIHPNYKCADNCQAYKIRNNPQITSLQPHTAEPKVTANKFNTEKATSSTQQQVEHIKSQQAQQTFQKRVTYGTSPSTQPKATVTRV